MATRPAEPRKILLLLASGKKRIVSGIPANAKITYGPVQPGPRMHGEANAVRIYTSQQNQLAVFMNVVEFIDLSLTVEDECVTAKVEQQNSKKPAEITSPFAHCSLSAFVADDTPPQRMPSQSVASVQAW